MYAARLPSCSSLLKLQRLPYLNCKECYSSLSGTKIIPGNVAVLPERSFQIPNGIHGLFFSTRTMANNVNTRTQDPHVIQLNMQADVKQRSLDEPITLTAIALLIIPAIGFCLGCWQVKRLKWKLGLIESLRKAHEEDPSRPIVELRNEHLVYAITWFSLSAFTLAMWLSKFTRIRMVIRQFRKRNK
ncbi:SURF1 family domain-containing protein [Ditylenchus destructor]|nr:SURF1 family domain-containing protein [Ditylenchus destructor]